MPDEADIANDYQDRLNRDGIQRVVGALHAAPHAAPLFCEWCEAEIPEPRRGAVPGCTLCLGCQQVKERLKEGL